jgi:hypothetical protein
VVLKFNAGIDYYSLDNHREKILPVEKHAGIFNLGLSSGYWEIISLF